MNKGEKKLQVRYTPLVKMQGRQLEFKLAKCCNFQRLTQIA